ncbi:hypothetical protein [Endozoicomonas euniceicola]|uniref:Secreted protein n=1 Tax=Endozoicomonas euniceicola TaxID=1234143 RepID=A0ABY6GV87_9GAMM|nr:hypothetical protein [Endozoicomonas euniceicola]UYM16502.1 hypothetical protein NX720_00775 [Endozoicomonas euniceicola]
MKMKKLAAFALLLPLSAINLAAFAGDEKLPDDKDKEEGQWQTHLEWTLAQNDSETKDQAEDEQPKPPEFTLSENDTTEQPEEDSTEDKPTEKKRG